MLGSGCGCEDVVEVCMVVNVVVVGVGAITIVSE